VEPIPSRWSRGSRDPPFAAARCKRAAGGKGCNVEGTPTRTARPCPNCGEPLGGPFCGQCGQADTALDVPFRRVVSELLAELLNADSRVWRTGRTLLFRPGLLTAEYNAGRRARYLPPLRVYMLSSLLFFFVVATARVQLLQ